MSEKRFRELLDRYLTNSASPEEREILDQFFATYESEAQGEGDMLNDPILHEHILRGIHDRLNVGRERRRGRSFTVWLSVAAATSLFVVVYVFTPLNSYFKEEPIAATAVEIQTVRGERSLTTLPDGSRVHLNGESQLSYLGDFKGKNREVVIRGEAFFEVQKDSRLFIVHADRVRTEVLGTSFNVKSRGGEDVEVTLAEGEVNVVSPTGESAILNPHQQAVVRANSGDIITKDVNIFSFISWKDNVLFFEHTPMDQVISTLESWYDVEIDILNPAIEQCLITAKYNNEPLGNVLASFEFLLNLNIGRSDEARFTISGKGCN